MRQNSFYSDSQVFTSLVENAEGVVQFTKKFNDFESAKAWAIGMTSDEACAYKVTDTETKRVLDSGRRMSGEIVPYSVEPEKEAPITLPGAAPILSKGVESELEHRDLIVKMLTEAGEEATEAKIISIAAEIARVHEKENPEYYDKLERVGL
jgi:hypothetical protein